MNSEDSDDHTAEGHVSDTYGSGVDLDLQQLHKNRIPHVTHFTVTPFRIHNNVLLDRQCSAEYSSHSE